MKICSLDQLRIKLLKCTIDLIEYKNTIPSDNSISVMYICYYVYQDFSLVYQMPNNCDKYGIPSRSMNHEGCSLEDIKNAIIPVAGGSCTGIAISDHIGLTATHCVIEMAEEHRIWLVDNHKRDPL